MPEDTVTGQAETPPDTSLGKKSASGAAWAGISRVVQQGTSAISIALLARFLSADDYGLMSMSGFFVNFLQQLGDMGTGSAIIQRPQMSQRLNSSLFWVNVLIGLVGTVLLWIAAPAISMYYREPRVVNSLLVLALSFPLAGVGIVPQSLLVRQMEYRKLFIVEVTAAVVSAVVAIVAAWSGAGIWSLVAGSLTMAGLTSVLSWIYSGWWPAFVIDWAEIRSVMGFSMNLTGFVLVNYFSRNTGHLIVGRYLGATALGYYQMAYSLLLYPLQALSSVLGRVMFAAFARMQTEPERFRSAMRRFLTLQGAVAFPVFFGLMVVADPVIRTFLGDKWIPVIPLFAIVAPFGAMQAVTGPTGQIYLSNGRTDIMLKLGVWAMIVQVLGYFAGLPWGLPGVLTGWAVATIPVGIAGLIVSHRLIKSPLKALFRELLAPALSALVMAGMVWGWRLWLSEQSVPRIVDLGSSILLGLVVYTAMVVWLRASFLRDVAQMLSYSNRPVFVRVRAWVTSYAPAE